MPTSNHTDNQVKKLIAQCAAQRATLKRRIKEVEAEYFGTIHLALQEVHRVVARTRKGIRKTDVETRKLVALHKKLGHRIGTVRVLEKQRRRNLEIKKLKLAKRLQKLSQFKNPLVVS